ncbi:hypothetical protein BH11PSE12_BH11PSE12_09080 [soil metagenome]
MGIFSLFGKKNNHQEKSASNSSSSKKTRSKGQNTVIAAPLDDEAFSQSIMAQRHIARATERKIDAIEFEMSRDMGRTKTLPTTTSGNPKPSPTVAKNQIVNLLEDEADFTDFASTLPLIIPSTDYLLGQNTNLTTSILTQSESVPVLEEAAILFASGQKDITEQMLQTVIQQDNLGNAMQTAWYMLFDLYQICNDQSAFEQLSLEYASKFETSPPLWDSAASKARESSHTTSENATPSLTFPHQLDASLIKSLEKLQQLSKQSRSLRLDFTRVKQVDPVGCGLLLRTFKHLKKSNHELILVGAQDFTDKIRFILEVGRRDETEAPWLLLLEVLQLLHFEKAFEEASIDYCVTFEVSPPSFEAPKNRVISASLQDINIHEELSDRFMMPTVIEGRTDSLISQILEHAKLHPTVLLDCSQLERVEFGASAQLLSGLVPIAGKKDTTIQFHEVNYLVMCLFNAMGLKNVAAIFPRKH